MDIELVLDCADLDRMTAFWTAALGYEHTGSAAQYAVLRDRDGRRPRLLLQRVDEPKSGKNRMHIDLSAIDIEVEAARLETLGSDASAERAPERARDRVDPDARPRGQRGVRLQAVRRHEQPARARCAAGAP